MARADRHGEPTFGETGYFQMTQGEHEAMRSAAKEAGMSFSEYIRQRLGLDTPGSADADGTVQMWESLAYWTPT